MPKIVVSYRRTDSDATGRICDQLELRYGQKSIFRDIDTIPFGADFRAHIEKGIRDADLLVAIIGPDWLGGVGQDARIHDPDDFVRIEIETAFERNIAVIPVLIGDSKMPTPAELPERMKALSFRNATDIDSGRNFKNDVYRLIGSMNLQLELSAEQKPRRSRARTLIESLWLDTKKVSLSTSIAAAVIALATVHLFFIASVNLNPSHSVRTGTETVLLALLLTVGAAFSMGQAFVVVIAYSAIAELFTMMIYGLSSYSPEAMIAGFISILGTLSVVGIVGTV